MKTKDLPKIAAGQLADSDCLLADCAAQGTGLVPFAVFSDYHIKRTGVWPSNPNLLDNARWDNIKNVINQRGLTEYTGTGYTIDRWKIANANLKTTIQNDCVRIAVNSAMATASFFVNFLNLNI